MSTVLALGEVLAVDGAPPLMGGPTSLPHVVVIIWLCVLWFGASLLTRRQEGAWVGIAGTFWLFAAAMAHFAPDLVSSYYALVLLALALGWRVASKQVSGLLPVKASRLTFVMRVSAVAIVVLGLAGQEAWGTLRAWPAALLAVGSACFWLVDAAMGGPPIALAGVSASVVLTAGLAGWRLGDEGVGALCAAATAFVVCASAGVLQRLRRTRGLPLLELTLGAAVMGTVVTLLLWGDTPISENTPVAYALGILGVAWLAASVASDSVWPAIVGGILASAAPIVLDAAPPLMGEPTTAHLVAVLAIATAVWFAAARLHHNHNFGILGLVASYGLFAAALNTFAPNWETGWYSAAVIGFSLAWSQARGRAAEFAGVDDDVVEWGSRVVVCVAILAAIGSEWAVQSSTDVLLHWSPGRSSGPQT